MYAKMISAKPASLKQINRSKDRSKKKYLRAFFLKEKSLNFREKRE